MHVAVYCASSSRVDPAHLALARAIGDGLARAGHVLVYGGGAVGLMGEAARAAHAAGGAVVGAIPERLKAREGIAYDACDELHVTATMAERKALMFTRAEAFLVLPGGLGTLEEFFEVLTLRTLGYHDKPILVVSPGGFYDPLLAFLASLEAQGFVRPGDRARFAVVDSAEAALAALA